MSKKLVALSFQQFEWCDVDHNEQFETTDKMSYLRFCSWYGTYLIEYQLSQILDRVTQGELI